MHFESSEHYIQKTSLVANCKTLNRTIDLEMLVVFVHGHGFHSAVNYFVYIYCRPQIIEFICMTRKKNNAFLLCSTHQH